MPPADLTSPVSLSELAHELRAPLGGIDAMVEMLEASDLDSGQAGMVEALKASHAHLRAIANRILDAHGSRGDIGAADQIGARPALPAFLALFAPSVQARCRARDIDFIVVNEAGEDGILIDDPVGLRQVLENLCDNATRLTSAGAVTLTIVREAQPRLAFAVTDTGPGLSEAEAARLIREGGRVTGRKGGAGLGLSIAGRIVAGHGGVLCGGPGPNGTGARFAFTWPIHGAGKLSPDCLIVDDHPASRLVMGTILKAAGYRCMDVPDPESALAAVRDFAPRIVLTDINMPNGDGRELARALRRLDGSIRPEVIAVSADDVDLAAPENAAFSAAVLKPITVRAVLDAVRAVATEREDKAA
ncbi:MAG TPA: hybrid sensor histidine kinase/response regulator [Rhabdaerophilum sp.]|nr:hybrid sensor histidine kinase/response regulator [Rhabdaerophilum sp.]